MEQLDFKYYCYVCQKYFHTKTVTASCLDCDSCAIEEAGFGQQDDISQEGLSRFQIYEVQNQSEPQQVLGTLQNVVHPRPQTTLQSVIRDSVRVMQGTITYNIDFSQNSTLFNLMRNLLGDGHTPHRATVEQISKLEKINYVKECSICQSVEQGQVEKTQQVKKSEEGQGYKLKCNHTFHQSCIKPWFERANTCPVCRTKID